MIARSLAALSIVWFAGASAFAHGTVTSQMKVATQKVVEIFDVAHKDDADKVTQITVEKKGEEQFLVVVKLPLKSYQYDCGLDIPTPKKWGCAEKR